MKSTYEAEITAYADKIPGDKGNYGWAVQFDNTGPADYAHEPGYIGITQFDENGNVKDRVLLSPEQSEALRTFIFTFRHMVGK